MGRTPNFIRSIVARNRTDPHAFLKELSATYRLCPATVGRSPRAHRNCSECPGAPCARMLARGLDDDGSPLPYGQRPECDANVRSGRKCRNRVVPGKTKCRLHGGASSGPKTAEGRARIAEAQRKRWRRRLQ